MPSQSVPIILTGWTVEELLEAAEAEDLSATKRLVVDWVRLGLLDRPSKKGLGRGAGWAPGTWPEEQRQLFLLLLRKRREVKHVRPLYNIPVALWLVWGDQHVPLRQARRALEGWAQSSTNASKVRARKVAKEQVELLAHGSAGGANQKALVEALAEVAMDPYSFDREKLLVAFRRVLDPRNTGIPRGPSGASLSAENRVVLLEARLAALRSLPDLPDEVFLLARERDRVDRVMYEDRWPALVAGSDPAQLSPEPTLEYWVRNACSNLLIQIGFIVVDQERDAPQTGGAR